MCRKTTFPERIAVLLFVSVAASCLRADQVVVGDESYIGAKIVGLIDGRLRFLGADGSAHTVKLNDVTMMVVDRGGVFADFNEAERFRGRGEMQRAAVRYRRMQRLAEGFWSDVIVIRLLQTLDAAGQIDKAVEEYIRVLNGRRSGPAAAAYLFPRNVPQRASARVGRAIDQIDGALSRKPEAGQRVLLEALRFDIMRRSGDKRVASGAARVASLSIPVAARSQTVYAILLDAQRRDVERAYRPELLASMDRAVRDCPRSLLPDFLLLKGGALLKAASTEDELIRASWPFLRAAIHFPDDPRAAQGLYGAALAVEGLGRADRARNLLAECLAHAKLTDEVRESALVAQERMASSKPE